MSVFYIESCISSKIIPYVGEWKLRARSQRTALDHVDGKLIKSSSLAFAKLRQHAKLANRARQQLSSPTVIANLCHTTTAYAYRPFPAQRTPTLMETRIDRSIYHFITIFPQHIAKRPIISQYVRREVQRFSTDCPKSSLIAGYGRQRRLDKWAFGRAWESELRAAM